MKRDDLIAQFSWYLLVGGSAFVVEIASFIAFMLIGFYWLPASIAAFIVAQITNYYLSYFLAFRRGRFGRTQEITRLLAVALVGLALNTAFVWLFITLGYLPLAAKITAVPFVLGWNFIGRRLFVFHKEMPNLTYQVTESVAEKVLAWVRSQRTDTKTPVQTEQQGPERF